MRSWFYAALVLAVAGWLALFLSSSAILVWGQTVGSRQAESQPYLRCWYLLARASLSARIGTRRRARRMPSPSRRTDHARGDGRRAGATACGAEARGARAPSAPGARAIAASRCGSAGLLNLARPRRNRRNPCRREHARDNRSSFERARQPPWQLFHVGRGLRQPHHRTTRYRHLRLDK